MSQSPETGMRPLRATRQRAAVSALLDRLSDFRSAQEIHEELRLPPERIMTPIDLGSHVLLYTPHAVVAAPYHRNEQGVLDAFRFFNEPIEESRAILEERGISLVVICPAMSEVRGLVAHSARSFVTLYAEDKLPAWLHE